ncbi:ABC transporter substrate-binding protein [Nocardiopsis coralli]|uniref:ABC transporter substrate-binding protein n=1 Tax=Nocardiopsis coralli TaxID=2772213 RepID=UPI002E298716|nr:ABC transporter substrate-binding protein [Nocardiopsis coralli]
MISAGRGAPSPLPRFSRRAALGTMAGGALASVLAGCGSGGGGTRVSLHQSKPEAIPYFGDLLEQFNDEHRGSIHAVHDISANLSSGFARGNPPDLGCLNYNFEMLRFQERGALSDLSDLEAEANIAPEVRELVEHFPTYPGRTSVIPYSMMAAAVLYNEEIFAEHDLEIPTTYSGFIELCETLQEAGVDPVYSTYADAWTVSQGLIDYSVGGSIDVPAFMDELRDLGPEAGPDAPVSFSDTLREPLEKMLRIASFSQPGAAARNYGDGNVAFARGEAAMYLQGPWALTEIDRIDPGLPIGIFPLPMTEDPDDAGVRVHLDLALWIPEAASRPDEARELLRFLIRPEIADPYNQANLGFGVREDAPDVTDARLQDLQSYVDRAAFYQGISQALPGTIPFENYCQAIVTGQSLEAVLRTLDEDWARLARR